MPALRPLPARPSLEYERKEAKALLRRLRAGDPDAVARARARHPQLDAAPDRVRLADAQLVIAREYGFASWPKLVRYFGDVERLRLGDRRSTNTRDFYDGVVRSLLSGHRQRRGIAGRQLASYVPRLYALKLDAVFAAEVTEDEARLATARQYGFPSWDVLLEHIVPAETGSSLDVWQPSAVRLMARAIREGDLDALGQLIDAHPEVVRRADDANRDWNPMNAALRLAAERGELAGPVIEWLEARGFDRRHELGALLCGDRSMTPDTVRGLLALGGDPNWVAPNGIPVLEHALIRYWNGAAVDVLAERAVPRQALWIAAGLGDLEGVRRSLDRRGKPTPAARRLRPDFAAVDRPGIPSHPDPDDDDILLEAFLVAMLNGRDEVMDHLASRGFDVNTLAWDMPLLYVAVGNGWTPAVASLMRCGANPDLRGASTSSTPREIARTQFEERPDDASRRRIVELLGMDPDAVLAERDARPLPAPELEPELRRAIALAGDDARRREQSEIGAENLLFGLLRAGGYALSYFISASGIDVDRFHADLSERVTPTDATEADAERAPLPMAWDAQRVLDAATTFVTERRRDRVQALHLLYALVALTRPDGGAAGALLARYGSGAAQLTERLASSL